MRLGVLTSGMTCIPCMNAVISVKQQSFLVFYFSLLNSSGSHPGAAWPSGRHLMGDIFVVTTGYYLPVGRGQRCCYSSCTAQDSPHSDKLLFSCSVMSDSATPWTVPHQVPLSMGFSGQKITQPKISMVLSYFTLLP